MCLSLESSGRSSYADLSSVDHDATSGGKQRMTGGQDEPPMADGTQDREVAGVDDARPLDRVAERPVRHRHRDPVAAAQAVDVAERGPDRGPGPGNGGRPPPPRHP